jgi:hypothetical protein
MLTGSWREAVHSVPDKEARDESGQIEFDRVVTELLDRRD